MAERFAVVLALAFGCVAMPGSALAACGGTNVNGQPQQPCEHEGDVPAVQQQTVVPSVPPVPNEPPAQAPLGTAACHTAQVPTPGPLDRPEGPKTLGADTVTRPVCP